MPDPARARLFPCNMCAVAFLMMTRNSHDDQNSPCPSFPSLSLLQPDGGIEVKSPPESEFHTHPPIHPSAHLPIYFRPSRSRSRTTREHSLFLSHRLGLDRARQSSPATPRSPLFLTWRGSARPDLPRPWTRSHCSRRRRGTSHTDDIPILHLRAWL